MISCWLRRKTIEKQGVYLVILFNVKWKLWYRSYFRASYGQRGLQRRIFKNHAMESPRNIPSNKGKYLYDLRAQSYDFSVQSVKAPGPNRGSNHVFSVFIIWTQCISELSRMHRTDRSQQYFISFLKDFFLMITVVLICELCCKSSPAKTLQTDQSFHNHSPLQFSTVIERSEIPV